MCTAAQDMLKKLKPAVLSADVTKRVVVDESLQDLDILTNQWKPLPQCDIYAAGFPCTPWSRQRGYMFGADM